MLERIPRSIFRDYDCEVLVVDDASGDRTAEIGRAYRQAHPEIRDDGAAQRVQPGLRRQPEGRLRLRHRARASTSSRWCTATGSTRRRSCRSCVAPLRDGQADAVFGSRMMSGFGALKGGMPLYKFVGNRILTRMQNLLLGTRLTEFHSGYRVYSVAALQKIRFRLNSNDFHFDTEIIIQLLNAGQRIVELPIPTYYGDEICRVNGDEVREGRDAGDAAERRAPLRPALPAPLRAGRASRTTAHYDLKLGYPSSHQFALDAVPPGASVHRHRRRARAASRASW